jgi:micrococcal nuclease
MKLLLKKAYLLCFVILLPTYLYAALFETKVVGISDGGTIKVLKDGKQVKIRLAAIDCPEKRQPYGQKAKQFTADMVAGKVVSLGSSSLGTKT